MKCVSAPPCVPTYVVGTNLFLLFAFDTQFVCLFFLIIFVIFSSVGTIQQLSNVSTGATPSEKSLKMMQKMGWSGGGLGKDEQGIATPLEHRKTGRGTGNIVLSDQCMLFPYVRRYNVILVRKFVMVMTIIFIIFIPVVHVIVNLLQQPDLSTSGSTQSMLPQLRKQPSVRGPPRKVILLRVRLSLFIFFFVCFRLFRESDGHA